MCDGVTQGQAGMELSLFSREVIALSAAVALSHDMFDAALFLGICDKIVPGLMIAALSFGHLPAVFVPAGPMPSGLPNEEKSKVRQQFAEGKVGRDKLLEAEAQSYHAPGTCTFYGTANSNQMLMEIMGMHLPGASFVNPDTPLRDALTAAAVQRAAQITALGGNPDYTPAGHVIDERSIVNGVIGLHATGGSTNHLLHLVAIAAAAGITLKLEDFDALSSVVPLLARVYPNGYADVNHFHQAGGMPFLIGTLLDAGLLHGDVSTVWGEGLDAYRRMPALDAHGQLAWTDVAQSGNSNILRPATEPFQHHGGLRMLEGNLGRAVIKVSSVPDDRHVIEAPAVIFHEQDDVRGAFERGELDRDFVAVVRFQGPQGHRHAGIAQADPDPGDAADRAATAWRWSPTAACPAPRARFRPRSTSVPRRSTAARWASCATATSCVWTRMPAPWTHWSMPANGRSAGSSMPSCPRTTQGWAANCSRCCATRSAVPIPAPAYSPATNTITLPTSNHEPRRPPNRAAIDPRPRPRGAGGDHRRRRPRGADGTRAGCRRHPGHRSHLAYPCSSGRDPRDRRRSGRRLRRRRDRAHACAAGRRGERRCTFRGVARRLAPAARRG